jgi:hypothetical protein
MDADQVLLVNMLCLGLVMVAIAWGVIGMRND